MPLVDENNFGAVALVLDRAGDALINLFVDEVAAYAQENARRDTNFYADHIIALHVGAAGLAAKVEVRTDRTGKPVLRQSVAIPAPPKNAGAVVAAAEYAIYIELEDNTIYQAYTFVGGQFDSLVSKIRTDFQLGD